VARQQFRQAAALAQSFRRAEQTNPLPRHAMPNQSGAWPHGRQPIHENNIKIERA
jgi:hypothetical protein